MSLNNPNPILLIWLILTSAQPVIAAPPAGEVGFEQRKLPDGTEIGIWYPASGTARHQSLGLYKHRIVRDAPVQGKRRALIVMSHGSGGSFAGHLDTASELARAGFVVAALTHPGDNWRDRSSVTDVSRRPEALSTLVSFMLDDWRSRKQIDAKRIGAFGFSAGGFTVIAAAGGQPDLSRFASHCAANPKFYDCNLVRTHSQASTQPWAGKKTAASKQSSLPPRRWDLHSVKRNWLRSKYRCNCGERGKTKYYPLPSTPMRSRQHCPHRPSFMTFPAPVISIFLHPAPIRS